MSSRLVLSCCFPPIVFLAACDEAGGLTRSVFLFLGDASYGVYILQTPIRNLLALTKHTPLGTGLETWAPVSGFCFGLIVVGVAAIVDRTYDVKVRAFLFALMRKAGNRKPAPSH